MSAPSVPLIKVKPRVGDGQLTFFWSPPATGPITQYNLSDGTTTTTLDSSVNVYTVTGLTNGTSYTYTLSATNGSGTGPAATFRTVQPGVISAPLYSAGSAWASPNAIITVWDAPATTAVATVKWTVLRNADRTIKTSAFATDLVRYTTGTFNPFTDYRLNAFAVNDPGYSSATAADVSGAPSLATGTLDRNARAWSSIAMSLDGTFIVAVVNGGFIYTSTNSGLTFTQRATTANWGCVACSSTGQYCAAGNATDMKLYLSNDYGATWAESITAPNNHPYNVAMSSDGQFILFTFGTAIIGRTRNFGVSWDYISGPSNFSFDVAVSADGTKAVVTVNDVLVRTVYSTNGGNTFFVSNLSGLTRLCLAMSKDGNIVYVGGGESGSHVYKSTNGGAIFTILSNSPNRSWNRLACSSDGSYVYGVDSTGAISVSLDSGTSWSTLPLSSGYQPTGLSVTNDGTTGIACINAMPSAGITRFSIPKYFALAERRLYSGISIDRPNLFYANSDLSILMGVANPASNATYPYFSKDFGKTWTGAGVPLGTYFQAACSSDGIYMYVVSNSNNNEFFRSINGGSTWARVDISGAGAATAFGVACSSDGSIVYVMSSVNTALFKSTNYGATFTQKTTTSVGTPSSTRPRVYTSSNGQYVYVIPGTTGALSGPSSRSSDYGETWSAVPSGSRPNLSNYRYPAAAITPDGSKILLGGSPSSVLYYSSDYGATWREFSFTGGTSVAWRGAGISADGTTMVAIGTSGNFWISRDSGLTWTRQAKSTTQAWQGCALSQDGTRLFTMDFNGSQAGYFGVSG